MASHSAQNFGLAVACMWAAGCSSTSSMKQTSSQAFPDVPEAARVLLAPWAGPYGGVPPFDRVRVEGLQPALEAAMALQISEVERIAANPEPATFDNTLSALERAGDALDRVSTIYGIWTSNMSSPEVQMVERTMSPLLAAHNDRITQNARLFARIRAIYESADRAGLTPEQRRLAWLYYDRFVRAGARLDSVSKARVASINQQLSRLFTEFSQNLLADEAQEITLDDGVVVRNTRSAVDPFLSTSDRRDWRERVWRMFINRGDNGDAHDNNQIIAQILKLRAERAKLLGFPTHAHYRLDIAMAKTPERAMQLMEAVWKPAVRRVHQEVADMQALADKLGHDVTIEPWDYRYYQEKVRAERYDLDQNEIRQYLQLDKLREAMFWVAGELHGFDFKPALDVPVFHPDVRVWEVTDRKTGKHIGLWYFDPYAREGKRSGAWMNAYRRQQKLDRPVTTIVSNNSNFVKPKPGEPVLISWDDAKTLFHEFGHALHGLSSNVTYPTLSGTSVPRDYVEFPSQLNEHWLLTPEVLQNFAVHYKTGQPIPQTLVDKIARAATFNEGFATTEYLASALVDMKLHLAGDRTIDPDLFERKTLAELGMPRELVMRHRTPQFGHVFSSDNYSAGYYSYLWSDVLTADAFDAFVEAGGPYDQTVAARLRDLLSIGNTVDPAEAYRGFRGRDPNVAALLRKKGF